MEYLSLFFGSVVAVYIGILTIKSFLFYRICSRFEREGDYVTLNGEVTHLHYVKKKAIQGKLEIISFPQYTTVFEEQEINYLSITRRLGIIGNC